MIEQTGQTLRWIKNSLRAAPNNGFVIKHATPGLVPASLLPVFRQLLAEREPAHPKTDRDFDELLRIAQARRRIDKGGYGVCEDCGDAIGLERLYTEPAATSCVVCQAAATHWSRQVTSGA